MIETDHSPYCEMLNLSPPSGAPPGPWTLYLYEVMGGVQVRRPLACCESCAVASWQPWQWFEARKAFVQGWRKISSVCCSGMVRTLESGSLETAGRGCLRNSPMAE